MKRRQFIESITRGAAWTLVGGIYVRSATAHPAMRARQVKAAAAAGGGGSCPADGSPSSQSDQVNESYRCGQTTSNRRTGQSQWTDGGTPRTICKLAFEITSIDGTVTGKTYNAFIYTMTGGNLNALQATSDNVSGPVAAGWLVFPFATPFLTSASVEYALIFGPTAPDASNLVWVASGDTDAIAGHREIFADDSTPNFGAGGTLDQSIRIYWQ